MSGQNSISLGMETKRISSRVSVEDEPEEMVSEQVRQKFISSIVQKLTLYSDPTSYGICIYKVPDKLRKMNEEAYRPRLVSVGPFHQGRPHLQPMERYKWRCVKKFLQRVHSDIAGVARIAWEMESSVRASYGDTFDNFSSQAFSEMIMLDGIFIVELLLESSGLTKGRDGAVLFDNPWMRSDILHDMMLLENQLPIFVPLQYWLITEWFTMDFRVKHWNISAQSTVFEAIDFDGAQFSKQHVRRAFQSRARPEVGFKYGINGSQDLHRHNGVTTPTTLKKTVQDSKHHLEPANIGE
ncbi:hypothetical protein RJ639_023507 [Escallonia herrerae]|uniref:Uncharacterized protein n=1 Tax=Escallonia herrerae TaxID=1293975 RepID=A0AA89ACE4_9ASTE|nr:hypothetical protein RJ639_023507 [Escallonia herrerae]